MKRKRSPREAGRLAQRRGKQGEEIAETVLRSRGVEMVEKIGQPVRLIRHPREHYYFRPIFGEKVSGDRRGILHGGISVLIETKHIRDANLTWSAFAEHQPGKLREHSSYGGLSLVVWVHEDGIFIMDWDQLDNPGIFRKGLGLTVEKAKLLDIENIAQYQKEKEATNDKKYT